MSRRTEIVLTIAALLLIIVIRSYHLAADPPVGMTFSTGVYTDSPAYTLPAKHFVQTGQFNPLTDERFVFFLTSGVTPVATVIFSLFGVSVLTSHLVGLLFSLGSLVLFYLIVRRVASPITAVLFLLLAGLNFNLIAYGRQPFLEHVMAFGAFGSLTCVMYWRGTAGHMLGGALLAASFLFGKVIGVVFLFPFACFLVFRLLVHRPDQTRLALSRVIAFVVGLAAVALVWYVLAYTPYRAEVSEYLQEHSVSLYGAPEGLESLDKFIFKLVSFGANSNLLERMITPSLLTAGFLFSILLGLSRPTFWRTGQAWFNAGHLFIAAMIVAFVGSLMIWNYQPLRYQIILIYPVCAAAAVVIVAMWDKLRAGLPRSLPWWYYLLAFPLALVVVYHLTGVILGARGEAFYYDDIKYVVVAITTALIAATPIALASYRRLPLSAIQTAARGIGLIALLASIGHGFYDFAGWVNKATYTSRDSSSETGRLLSAGAVLSGPFGPLLAMENDHMAVIHMFGVSSPDPAVFRTFPITHLALDQPNEDRAREDYPEIFRDALHVATHRVGKVQIRIYNIAHSTGNPVANLYQESLFEQGAAALQTGDKTVGADLIHRFNQQFPENQSGQLVEATIAQAAGRWEMAEDRYKKAVEFSPTNYVLYERLAAFYEERYAALGNPADKEKGLEHYRRAMFYAPTAQHIAPRYHRLQVSEPWQLRDTTSSSRP